MKDTKQKLMNAMIDLVYTKGYRAVTTKEVAQEAGVSEKTLFRHFPTKLALLEHACNQSYYAAEFQFLIEKTLVFDIEKDLTTILTKYHEIVNENRKIFIISLKEEEHLPELRRCILKHPQSLLKDLEHYLDKMVEMKKIRAVDTKTTAFLLITSQYGAFINHIDSERNFPDITPANYIRVSVETFVKGLKP